MAWDTELVLMLRHFVDDVDSPQTYSDSRLKTLIIIAAQQLISEADFKHNYIINLSAETIVPDPTDPNNKDNAFMNLVVLKAACILNKSVIRLLASQGAEWKDGSSFVKLSGRAGSQQKLADSFCDAFESAKFDHLAGSLIPGRAILGPFSSDQFITTNHNVRGVRYG